MKISELSETTGASARSIRHYEKKNLIKANRLDNGYREFDDSVIERIKTIQLYLGLGLTTDQIEEVLDCTDQYSDKPYGENGTDEYSEYCYEMLVTYEKKLEQINGQMRTLAEVKGRLENYIGDYKAAMQQQEAETV